MTTVLGLPLLALGIAAVGYPFTMPTISGVYAGFLGAMAIWGWIELAFLTGVITGPERNPCPHGLSGWARFSRAWGVVACHEIALALGMIGLLVAASGSENHTAVWTYLTLLSFAVACFAERMIAAKTPALDMQFTLLTALALLEHWLMVLPLPDAKLWRWMLPAAKRLPDPK